MTRNQWTAALALSAAVHLAVAGIYDLNPQPQPLAAGGDAGEGVEIALAPGAPTGDPTVTAVEEAPVEPTPAPPPPPPPTPEPAVEKAPEQAPQTELAAVTAPAASENLVVAAAEPEEQPEPQPEPPRETPAASVPDSALEATGEAASAEARPLPKGSSQVYGKRHPGGGKSRNANQYFGQVMAWMNKHKHYPAELKKKKQEGVVEIQFTLGRDGELLAASIAKSCGIKALDDAALQMMADAAPLPPMPDFIAEDTITLVIPVEYSLITNAVN